MNALSSDYRIFSLPWNTAAAEERLFKRLLAGGFTLFAIFMLLVALLPPMIKPVPAPLPREVVNLVLQPPPVEDKPKIKPPEIKKPEVVKPPPVVVQKPVVTQDRVSQARQKAQASGLLAQKDLLKDLRETLDPSTLAPTKDLLAKVDGASKAERSVITSQATSARSAVNTATLAQGFGGGAGSLKGHQTTQSVASFADQIGKNKPEASRTGSGAKPARSREEIETVFDRNKSAIFALYNRALRDNAQLQGKVVVELTISPEGEVTACRIVSSDLKDEELERKLIARIKLFRFDARDVAPITTTKPIDFFPS